MRGSWACGWVCVLDRCGEGREEVYDVVPDTMLAGDLVCNGEAFHVQLVSAFPAPRCPASFRSPLALSA